MVDRRQFDWQSIMARTTTGRAMLLLTSAQIELLSDAVGYAGQRWRWNALSDSEYDQLDALVSSAELALRTNIMIGTIIHTATSVAPFGTLVCDGATYQREDYPALYDVLADAYIVDSETFTVPDLIGRHIRGGPLSEIGDELGEDEHVLTIDELPEHTHDNEPHAHQYTPPVINIDVEAPGVPDPVAAGIGLPTSTSVETITIVATGGGEAHNNIPASTVLLPCIVAL